MDYKNDPRIEYLNKTNTEINWLVLAFGLFTFIVGMVIGSLLHDMLFHAIEQVMK